MAARMNRHLVPVVQEQTEEDKRVGDALDTLRPEFVTCRDLGHVWEPFTARWFARDRFYVQTLKCPRCGTERTRELNEYGHPNGQHYTYQEGYQMPKGTGYLTSTDRDKLRLRSVLAVLPGGRVTKGRRA